MNQIGVVLTLLYVVPDDTRSHPKNLRYMLQWDMINTRHLEMVMGGRLDRQHMIMKEA